VQRMIAETRQNTSGRMELVVAGILIAVEGGFLHDERLVAAYRAAEQEAGIAGSGRYWTPVLLKLAARTINSYGGGRDREIDMVEELRKVYPGRRK
jgi:hypothetical protein